MLQGHLSHGKLQPLHTPLQKLDLPGGGGGGGELTAYNHLLSLIYETYFPIKVMTDSRLLRDK